jgi:hypothetical protein
MTTEAQRLDRFAKRVPDTTDAGAGSHAHRLGQAQVPLPTRSTTIHAQQAPRRLTRGRIVCPRTHRQRPSAQPVGLERAGGAALRPCGHALDGDLWYAVARDGSQPPFPGRRAWRR